MTTEKIAPCPWCGKEPVAMQGMNWEGHMVETWWVVCKSTGHDMQGPYRKTLAGAIKAWNERRPK